MSEYLNAEQKKRYKVYRRLIELMVVISYKGWKLVGAD